MEAEVGMNGLVMDLRPALGPASVYARHLHILDIALHKQELSEHIHMCRDETYETPQHQCLKAVSEACHRQNTKESTQKGIVSPQPPVHWF